MATHDLLSPSFSFDNHMSFSLNFNPDFTSRLLLDLGSDNDEEEEAEEESEVQEQQEDVDDHGSNAIPQGKDEDHEDKKLQLTEVDTSNGETPQVTKDHQNLDERPQVKTDDDDIDENQQMKEEIDRTLPVEEDTNQKVEVKEDNDATSEKPQVKEHDHDNGGNPQVENDDNEKGQVIEKTIAEKGDVGQEQRNSSESREETGGEPAAAKTEGEEEAAAQQEGEEKMEEVEEDKLSNSELQDVAAMEVPKHPMPAMQDAFAESMMEASSNPIRIPKKGDSAARRKFLLDQGASEDTHAGRWRQQPGQQWHQLWKLMSQISFGIFLLLNGLARDDNQVVAILQGHIDEVDDFLEMTLDDFDLAQEDINVRLKHLMMPLENIGTFEDMLEDRQFRLQIVTGNERIEHIITRTARAMDDALKDVEQGLAATKVFVMYLAQEQQGTAWKVERPDMHTVFDAMKGNAGGWQKAYASLQGKGQHLGASLAQLGSIIADMNRRAAEISRRMTYSVSPDSSRKSTVSSPLSSPPGSHMSRPSAGSLTKELPPDPTVIAPAIRVALPTIQNVGDRDRVPKPDQDFYAEAGEEPNHEPEHEPSQTLRSTTYISVCEPTLQLDDIIDYQISAFPQPPGTPRSEVFRSLSERSQSSLSPKTSPSSQNSPPNVSRTTSSRISPARLPIPRSPPLSAASDSAYFSNTSSAASPSIPLARTLRGPSLSSFPSIQTTAIRSSHTQPFYAVPASPHSPLQRPWTAAPSHYPVRRPSLANIRTTTVNTTSQLSHSTSVINKPNKSQLSEVTTFDSLEREVKHKKSGSSFGWIKKAFSLTEEEKAAFERRRKGPVPPTRLGRPPRTAIVDARRMR